MSLLVITGLCMLCLSNLSSIMDFGKTSWFVSDTLGKACLEQNSKPCWLIWLHKLASVWPGSMHLYLNWSLCTLNLGYEWALWSKWSPSSWLTRKSNENFTLCSPDSGIGFKQVMVNHNAQIDPKVLRLHHHCPGHGFKSFHSVLVPPGVC